MEYNWRIVLSITHSTPTSIGWTIKGIIPKPIIVGPNFCTRNKCFLQLGLKLLNLILSNQWCVWWTVWWIAIPGRAKLAAPCHKIASPPLINFPLIVDGLANLLVISNPI